MTDAAAAEADVRARVGATLERLQRVDVAVVSVAPPDAERRFARQRAHDAAVAAGRRMLLDEAIHAARELAMQAFSRRGFTGTWAVTDWSISTARAGDRVAVAAAFEDAVTAAATEDLVDAATLDTLRATSEELAMLTGTPEPGALSTLGLGLRSWPARLAFIVLGAGLGFAVLFVPGMVVGAGSVAIATEIIRRRAARR